MERPKRIPMVTIGMKLMMGPVLVTCRRSARKPHSKTITVIPKVAPTVRR